jgi:hypothetical protein
MVHAGYCGSGIHGGGDGSPNVANMDWDPLELLNLLTFR